MTWAIANQPTLDTASRRRALWVLVLVVPAPSVGTAMAMIIAPGKFGAAAFALSKLWMFALPLWWWLKVDRGRLSLSPARQGGLAVGVALGLLISAAIFTAYLLVGRHLIDVDLMRQTADRTGLSNRAFYLGGCVYWVAVNSLMEEYVYRWFITCKCVDALAGLAWTPTRRGAVAVLASALFFTIHHVIALAAQGFSLPLIVLTNAGIFIGAALWSGLYLRYRSIWPGYVSHAIVDVSVFIIGWKLIFG